MAIARGSALNYENQKTTRKTKISKHVDRRYFVVQMNGVCDAFCGTWRLSFIGLLAQLNFNARR
jgi:hypothetical protein